jgi:hypothetical protein
MILVCAATAKQHVLAAFTCVLACLLSVCRAICMQGAVVGWFVAAVHLLIFAV